MHQLIQNFKELTVRPKNAQELKGLILQLAIQGKLTANWRLEHPEVELDTENLKKYSKKSLDFLIKESKSIDKLDVPSTWLKLKFKTLFEMQGGSQPPKSRFSSTKKEGYIQLYQIRDFGKRPVPVYVPIESVSKLCSEDDIMIGRYGASIGKVFYGKNGAYNVALVKLIWNRDLIEQKFVYQIFSSYYMQEFFQNCTRSAQAGFNKTDMGKLNIPIPPLEEQKEIVKVVGTLFKEVEQLEQLTVESIALKEDFVTSALNQLTTNNAKQERAFLQEHFQDFFNETNNIKKLRETVLQLAVQGKLTQSWRESHPELVSGSHHARELLKRIHEEKAQLIKDKKIKKEKPLPPIAKDEIPYEIPEGWAWEYLGASMLKITDGTHHSPINIENGAFKYVSAKNIKSDGIKLSNITYVIEEVHKDIFARCNPELGDLLYIKDGATTGICCINNLDEEFSMLSSVALIKMPSVVLNEYLLRVMRSPYYYELMRAGMTGVAITRVTLTKLKASIVPIPPLEEQKVIVQKVNALMGLCDSLEQEVQQSQKQSEQLMKSCLREVIEGNKNLVDV